MASWIWLMALLIISTSCFISGGGAWTLKLSRRLATPSTQSRTLSSPLASSWMSSRSRGVMNVSRSLVMMSWVMISPWCSMDFIFWNFFSMSS